MSRLPYSHFSLSDPLPRRKRVGLSEHQDIRLGEAESSARMALEDSKALYEAFLRHEVDEWTLNRLQAVYEALAGASGWVAELVSALRPRD